MKSLIALICFISVLSVNAQIKVTNKTSYPITICVAYYKSTSNYEGFISEGWWKIIPGETKVIGGKVHNGENTFYYYAYNETSKWKGDNYFAITKDKFEILNADKNYVLENNSKFYKQGFRKRTFHIGILDALSYSFDLTE